MHSVILKILSILFLTFTFFSSVHASDNGDGTPFFNIDKMIINLAPPDINRYVQISFAYETSDPIAQQNLQTYLPVIRSRVLMVLSTKTAQEIKTIQGKQELLDQVLEVARLSLPEQLDVADKGIKDVHITSIVVQ